MHRGRELYNDLFGEEVEQPCQNCFVHRSTFVEYIQEISDLANVSTMCEQGYSRVEISDDENWSTGQVETLFSFSTQNRLSST